MGRSRPGRTMLIARRIFGLLYVLAGVAKAFPGIEDVGAELREAALANRGTPLASISQSLASHVLSVTALVGVAMAAAGYSLLRDRLLAPAAVGQAAMLLGFMVVLHRAYPIVLLVDLPFLALAAAVLRGALLASRQARAAAGGRQTVHRDQH